MFDLPTILKPNATEHDRALEQAIRRGKPDLTPIATLMNPETCPAHLLGWLAWALAVDEWEDDWSNETKRAVIAASFDVHRHKGTIGSIRRVLTAAGYGSAQIIEGRWSLPYDGSINHDGNHDFGGADHWSTAQRYDGSVAYSGLENHGDGDHWAQYRIRLPRPITVQQAQVLRRLLKNTAPARCHLKRLYFTEVSHLFDRAISHDGTYTYGAA